MGNLKLTQVRQHHDARGYTDVLSSKWEQSIISNSGGQVQQQVAHLFGTELIPRGVSRQ